MATADGRDMYGERIGMTHKVPPSQGFLKRHFRRLSVLAGALTLLLGLVAFAPTILGCRPVVNVLARYALSDLKGQVRVGSASFGWLSPIEVGQVELSDAEGRPLATVERITSSRSLLSILRDRSELGTFRCEKPVVEVVSTADATNWERAFANWASKPARSGASNPTAVALEIVDGKLHVLDQEAQKEWTVDGVGMTVSLPGSGSQPMRVELRGRVGEGSLQIALDMQQNESGSSLSQSRGSASVEIDAFPLAILAPVLQRIDPSTRLDGRLQARLSGKWGGSASFQGGVEGKLAVENLVLSTPSLGADKLQMVRVDVPCKLSADGDIVRLDKFEIASDLGKASLIGSFDLRRDLATLAMQPGCQAEMDIDLARLAEKLPHTLRLQKDTRVTAGKLKMLVRSLARTDGITWEGKLDSSGLKGLNQGQPIAWDDPLAITFTIRRDKDTIPVVERLYCNAGFLTIEGSGSLDKGQAKASYDLGRLANQLGRFIDLGSVRLGGQGTSQLVVERNARSEFTLTSESQLRQVEIAGLSKQPIREDNLLVRLDATGALLETCRLDTASARLVAGQEEVLFRLLEPIADVTRLDRVAIRAGLRGDLARIQKRLQPWISGLEGLQLQGPSEVVARIRYAGSADTLEVEDLHLDSSLVSCQAKGSLAKLSGSQDLKLSGDLSYDLEKFEPFLRPYLGASVKITGRDTRPFQLEGSLASAQPLAVDQAKNSPGMLTSFKGKAALGWQAMQAFGCQVGPGQVRAELKDGWLHVQPIRATMNQGRLILQSGIRLEPGPAELYLPKGLVLERAHITPAMGASALGYVAPVLVGVTETDGELSVALEGARVPLGNPLLADVSGVLTLHQARIGASPLVRELAVLLQGPATLLAARECAIPFRLVEGRVHHRDLVLVFPDLTIRTQGWVGLDGTMSLVAEMPVPPRWLGQSRLNSALAKQTIRLPIGGTMSRPKLDEQALRAVSAQIIRETAGDLIKQELDDRLKGIFKPGR